MKEIKQIIQAFEVACSKQQKAALATVVHVAGSSYRGPGARMLITEDGMLTGAISGGCLEGDALRKALMVMMQGKPLLTTYDTSDEEDAIIGVGLGCNGIIQVLIEPIVSEDPTNPIILLQSILQKRQAAVLVTFFSLQNKWSEQQGTRLLLKADGAVLKADVMPVALQDVMKEAAHTLENKEAVFLAYEEVSAFFEYVPSPVSLIIAGAGNDVFPLVQMSEVLGWDLTLIDGRPKYANTQRFPSCQIIVAEPEKALLQLVMDDRTAVVLMTHNYNYDKALLKALLPLPVNYIGMLGPKKKLSRMQTELAEEGIQLPEERVFSPVGLDIGAETAEEIALAILAEIKAVFAGKTGVYLRNYAGQIHQRKTEIITASTFK